ncbi:MAG: MBL fold metallo-hydrolase [Bryobacteraceae bacterium]|nr:MBL fold metallo-hydrolase [Bryobacteraceae bacterium]
MARTLALRSCALVCLAGGLWLAYTQQAPEPLVLEKIADDLHVLSGSGGNVAIYVTGEGAILVDDKFERNVPEILANVKKVTDAPVRYVLNTHQHGDHSGGNQALMKATPTEVISHRNARANMAAANMPGLARVTFSDETAVHLGGKEVRARHFGRGHTNGDAVIYFPAHKTIHTGDLFIAGAPLIDYSAGGSGIQWTKTIDAILEWEFDRVIPGHGPVMTRADLVAWKRSFEVVRDRVSKLKREGKSKQEAEKLLDFSDQAPWMKGFAGRLWTRSYSGLYDEL